MLMSISKEIPQGQLFSHLYIERGLPQNDSKLFRRRLATYYKDCFDGHLHSLGTFVNKETGLGCPTEYYGINEFFLKVPIARLLDIITVIWKYFMQKREGAKAGKWHQFVARAMSEEYMGYFLDERCGVHYLVDQEFDLNRKSTLMCLESPRYGGVRGAFESAYKQFDSQPQDTKAAVRYTFEAVEILAKQMVDTKNLNKSVVEKMLKPIALRQCGPDKTACEAVSRMFDGFGQWVDAIHFYRHGQGEPDPVSPSIDFTVYVLSSGASFLRWLITIDSLLTGQASGANH